MDTIIKMLEKLLIILKCISIALSTIFISALIAVVIYMYYLPGTIGLLVGAIIVIAGVRIGIMLASFNKNMEVENGSAEDYYYLSETRDWDEMFREEEKKKNAIPQGEEEVLDNK